jgi:hypothetical protein
VTGPVLLAAGVIVGQPGPVLMRGPRPAGARVYCVDWVPGTDRLRGTCHCGAVAEASDPARMWEWLLAHPAHP